MATVVVANDDLDALEQMRAALTSVGQVVVVASSMDAALTALSRAEIDVFLSDIDLSVMSGGIMLCANLAASRPDIPVVLLSADLRLDTSIAAVRAGVYEYLLKPISLTALHAAVERAARHSRLRRRILGTNPDLRRAARRS